jgi:phage gpG-like protein
MKIDVVDTATPILNAIAGRVRDLTPLMTLMKNHMMVSIRQNFDVGGRPIPWAPLKNEEVGPKGSRSKRYRRVQSRPRMGGPLVMSGNLRDSIGGTPEADDLVLYARPDTDPIKAWVHQYGTENAGRNHNVTIPARPYLVWQEDDLDWFRKGADGWIRMGSRG